MTPPKPSNIIHNPLPQILPRRIPVQQPVGVTPQTRLQTPRELRLPFLRSAPHDHRRIVRPREIETGALGGGQTWREEQEDEALEDVEEEEGEEDEAEYGGEEGAAAHCVYCPIVVIVECVIR